MSTLYTLAENTPRSAEALAQVRVSSRMSAAKWGHRHAFSKRPQDNRQRILEPKSSRYNGLRVLIPLCPVIVSDPSPTGLSRIWQMVAGERAALSWLPITTRYGSTFGTRRRAVFARSTAGASSMPRGSVTPLGSRGPWCLPLCCGFGGRRSPP